MAIGATSRWNGFRLISVPITHTNSLGWRRISCSYLFHHPLETGHNGITLKGKDKLKAVQLITRGKAGVKITDLDSVSLPPNSVRLRMLAASVNRVDLYMRDSGQGIRHSLPLVMGFDGVGEVLEVSEDVPLEIGQTVILYPYDYCGHCRFCLRGDQTLCISAKIFGEHIDGTFREEMVVPAKSVLPLADGTNIEHAAALGVAYLTAWRMVFGKGPIEPGMNVLIQGAGGGVSYAAMQLAKVAGAQTIVTTTGSNKLKHFASLDVDVIDYKAERVKEAVWTCHAFVPPQVLF